MAQKAVFVAISLFFNLLSLFLIPCISSKPNSIILKLIHRDSPLSPFYQPNISDFEHLKKNLQLSESRSLFFQQNKSTKHSKTSKNFTIRLPLEHVETLFTVELAIGTPAVKQTLIFDTGSRITWTQCRPCIKCFKQTGHLFDPKKSVSYSRITQKDNLANTFTCAFSSCYYYVHYYSGQFSAGIASKESFTFETSTGITYKAKELVFGCGHINGGSYGNTRITGLLGMDKHPISFARQLGKQIKSRFSYCLPTMNNDTKSSFLRFGKEAIIRTKNIRSSPFVNLNREYSHYALNLTDISIDGERLGLKPDTFPHGCVIDSGSTFSLIEQEGYSSVQESLKRYFSKFQNIKRVIIGEGIERRLLCYSYKERFNSFPNMTFHFQGADLNIPPENVFLVESELKVFCLLMLESTSLTLLGAYQQQNTRFVYDLDKDMLSFAKEDCSKDAVI